MCLVACVILSLCNFKVLNCWCVEPVFLGVASTTLCHYWLWLNVLAFVFLNRCVRFLPALYYCCMIWLPFPYCCLLWPSYLMVTSSGSLPYWHMPWLSVFYLLIACCCEMLTVVGSVFEILMCEALPFISCLYALAWFPLLWHAPASFPYWCNV